MSKFIHHETVEAKRSTADDQGRYSIVETDEGFSVYEGGYCHASDLPTLEAATDAAQKLADDFDYRSYPNDFERAKAFPDRYTWGPVVNYFEVGPYRILEHHPHKLSVNGVVHTDEPDESVTEFHVFIEIDGAVQDTCNGFDTLDDALAGAIAYRLEGANHRADRYFMAALNALKN